MSTGELAVSQIRRLVGGRLFLVIQEIPEWDEWEVLFDSGKIGILSRKEILQFSEETCDETRVKP